MAPSEPLSAQVAVRHVPDELTEDEHNRGVRRDLGVGVYEYGVLHNGEFVVLARVKAGNLPFEPPASSSSGDASSSGKGA